MGTHVSKVRSLVLDSWDTPFVDLFAAMQSSTLDTTNTEAVAGPNAVWAAALRVGAQADAIGWARGPRAKGAP